MNALSNPYSAEILNAVANRITRDRLLIAHDWIHERMTEFGADALGAEAMNLIGAPVERRWLSESHTLLDILRRLHDQSWEAPRRLRLPTLWLLAGLLWSLDPSANGDAPDIRDVNPKTAVGDLFAEGSRTHEILSAHLRCAEDDDLALMGGAWWSLAYLSTWAPVLIASQDHAEALAEQGPPRDLAVSMFSDLRAEILGDGRMEEIRDISRRRQGRSHTEQIGEE